MRCINSKKWRGLNRRYAETVAILAYAAAIIAVFYYLPYAISFFAFGLFIHALARNKKESGSALRHSATMEFIRSLSESGPKTKSAAIMSSIPVGFNYKDELYKAIASLKFGVDSETAFSEMLSSSDFNLRKIGLILYSCFRHGVRIKDAARLELENDSEKIRYAIKASPMLANSEAMMLGSTNFFFPAFAGITLNIMKFSNGSAYTATSTLLMCLFVYYIANVNFGYISRHRFSFLDKTARVMRLSAFAAIVMGAVLEISSIML
ncbi:hypothetical protein M1583_00870 [Candidatus Marsarchaeota archaeon]|nr:hypothetical protein [Candidatus Marsarchaeota archaeon]